MARQLRMVGLMAAGGLLVAGPAGPAGCGAPPAEVRADPRATARLHDVLHDRPRLPDGFSPRPGKAWRIPFKPRDPDCLAVLQPAGGRAPATALTAQAAASYQGDELGEHVAVGLARYAGSQAEEHLDDLADALEQCRKVRAPGGTRLTTGPLPLSLEGKGDQAVGAVLSGRLNGYPYTMDLVLVRSGDTLVSLVHAGLAPVDPQRTGRLLGAVLEMAT